ncbi:HigA family addiction module antitoxin [Brevundimonas sp. BH3]|uniref:HigA family addiction module antitoxin n=1 Tax=Brevundimonas sp. BH3 TaxID=3133089 RepID=UPI00324D2C3A
MELTLPTSKEPNKMSSIDYSSFKSPLNHPGEHLKLEYLPTYGLSPAEFSYAIGVDSEQTIELLNGERSMTAELALRLARFFNMSPEFWMNLQVQMTCHERRYDLEGSSKN